MDGPLADFEQGVFDALNQRYHPNIRAIPLDQRQGFRVKDQYPAIVRPIITAIYNADGFALSLKPTLGAIQAVTEMVQLGLKVYICTSPLSDSATNASDKINWIKIHFNSELARRVIITKDKTLVKGDYLIDDRPQVKGIATPTWQHLLFAAPTNNHIQTTKITWQNWQDFILA